MGKIYQGSGKDPVWKRVNIKCKQTGTHDCSFSLDVMLCRQEVVNTDCCFFFVILMSCCVTSHIFILLDFINLASAFIPSLSQNRGLLNRAHPLSAMQTAVTHTHMLRRNEGANPRGVKKREDSELQWSAVFMSFYILFAGAITQSSHCANI